MKNEELLGAHGSRLNWQSALPRAIEILVKESISASNSSNHILNQKQI
jgi:hypothetical protein